MPSNNLKLYKMNDYEGESYYICTKCEKIFILKREIIKHLKNNNCEEINDDQWFEDDWLDHTLFGLVECINKYRNDQIDEMKDFIDSKTSGKIKKLLKNIESSSIEHKEYIKNILGLYFRQYKDFIIKTRRPREISYEYVKDNVIK